MAVYLIGFRATVYHNECIEASNREEADAIAEKLLRSEAYDQRLYTGFTDSVCYDEEICPAVELDDDEDVSINPRDYGVTIG